MIPFSKLVIELDLNMFKTFMEESYKDLCEIFSNYESEMIAMTSWYDSRWAGTRERVVIGHNARLAQLETDYEVAQQLPTLTRAEAESYIAEHRADLEVNGDYILMALGEAEFYDGREAGSGEAVRDNVYRSLLPVYIREQNLEKFNYEERRSSLDSIYQSELALLPDISRNNKCYLLDSELAARHPEGPHTDNYRVFVIETERAEPCCRQVWELYFAEWAIGSPSGEEFQRILNMFDRKAMATDGRTGGVAGLAKFQMTKNLVIRALEVGDPKLPILSGMWAEEQARILQEQQEKLEAERLEREKAVLSTGMASSQIYDLEQMTVDDLIRLSADAANAAITKERTAKLKEQSEALFVPMSTKSFAELFNIFHMANTGFPAKYMSDALDCVLRQQAGPIEVKLFLMAVHHYLTRSSAHAQKFSEVSGKIPATRVRALRNKIVALGYSPTSAELGAFEELERVTSISMNGITLDDL